MYLMCANVCGLVSRLATPFCFVFFMSSSMCLAESLPRCPADPNVFWTNCWGDSTGKNGQRYVGSYNENKRNGRGVFTFSGGSSYVGQFRNGEYDGIGTYTFADGDIFVGTFKNSKYDGLGILYAANGTVRQKGLWENNSFVRTAVGAYPTCPHLLPSAKTL